MNTERQNVPALIDIIASGRAIADHRPCPRRVVDAGLWQTLAQQIAEGRWTLFGLWGDKGAVHMAVLDETAGQIAVVTHECPEGNFPSVGRLHPPAIRPERTIRDLFGLEPVGLPDPRPWLDHGRWDLRHPLGTPTEAVQSAFSPRYEFLASEGEGLHQIAVGPVHAGIIEPGHFRFTASGETVVRLEERFGYAHKGIESLMMGASIDAAARLAGRVSGDSTVAYSFAFARAVESALNIEVPPRAIWLRALMAELERLANHFGDIGAICNDAAFAMMHAYCGVLRERVLRTSAECFGHRLMMDCIVPGGVSIDLPSRGFEHIRQLVGTVNRGFPPLVELYDNTASLQDRTVGTGIVHPALARQYGCGGYIGRASGRAFDARLQLAYPPYDALLFNYDVPLLTEGDVNARIWIRIREVAQSLALVELILARIPAQGPTRVVVTGTGNVCEGMAVVEGFRGDVLAWVRLGADARVERCHLRDPSWFQWPLLEAAIEGNIVADFPLCNKSFNCSYSGHDL
jgi:Ni,Fe-hydrogenase III large subunit